MPSFAVSQDGPIAHLQLTRPEASNALDPAVWTGMPDTVRALDDAGGTRALVISGQGRHFCAGMDLAAFAGNGPVDTATPAGREAFTHMVRRLQDTFTALEQARFPVIAAIQGACIGAGLDMASACDLRIVSADAYFRIEEINIGMMADVGSLQRLPKIMPEGVVKELAFLGTTLNAERARAAGFVMEVTETAEEALGAAMAAAERIAGKAPLAIAGSKRAIHFARDHGTAEALDWAAWAQASLWNMAEIGEAIAARAEKREGAFADVAPRQRMGG